MRGRKIFDMHIGTEISAKDYLVSVRLYAFRHCLNIRTASFAVVYVHLYIKRPCFADIYTRHMHIKVVCNSAVLANGGISSVLCRCGWKRISLSIEAINCIDQTINDELNIFQTSLPF